MKFNKYWFKPKKYGIGSYPSSWEGYSITLLFIILIITIILQEGFQIYKLIIVILLLIPFIILSKNKTDGEWKWRWS